MPRLLNFAMNDGSRHFASLPATASWYSVRDHAMTLPGATVTGFLCDEVTEAWIDFTYKGEAFTINDQFGEYWFCVTNPRCPESLLSEVAAHWERLLGPVNA
jgi:hypothetical protein